jgi:hypothetical protein
MIAVPVVSSPDNELRLSVLIGRLPELDIDAHVKEMEPMRIDTPVALEDDELCGRHRPHAGSPSQSLLREHAPSTANGSVWIRQPDDPEHCVGLSRQAAAQGGRHTRPLVPAECRVTATAGVAPHRFDELEPSGRTASDAVDKGGDAVGRTARVELEAVLFQPIEAVREAVRHETGSMLGLPLDRVERVCVFQVNPHELLEVAEIAQARSDLLGGFGAVARYGSDFHELARNEIGWSLGEKGGHDRFLQEPALELCRNRLA